MQALEKTFDIVDCLESSGPTELAAIAEHTGLPRSTVHHHLADLQQRGLVVSDDGTYRISLRFLDIGERARRRTQLFQTARSEIDELSQSIDRPVTIFVLEQGQAVVLYTCGEDPSLPVTLHPGEHLPLHATAGGKAILSASPEAICNDLIDCIDLHSYTQNTISDAEVLEMAVKEVMNRGYAIAEEERKNGRCGIAVPFSTGKDGPIAAVEVSFTLDGAKTIDRDDLVSELDQTVNVIDIKTDYS